MLFFQKWDENTFEYNFLKLVKNNIKDKNKCKIYIGKLRYKYFKYFLLR